MENTVIVASEEAAKEADEPSPFAIGICDTMVSLYDLLLIF